MDAQGNKAECVLYFELVGKTPYVYAYLDEHMTKIKCIMGRDQKFKSVNQNRELSKLCPVYDYFSVAVKNIMIKSNQEKKEVYFLMVSEEQWVGHGRRNRKQEMITFHLYTRNSRGNRKPSMSKDYLL